MLHWKGFLGRELSRTAIIFIKANFGHHHQSRLFYWVQRPRGTSFSARVLIPVSVLRGKLDTDVLACDEFSDPKMPQMLEGVGIHDRKMSLNKDTFRTNINFGCFSSSLAKVSGVRSPLPRHSRNQLTKKAPARWTASKK